MVIMIEMAIATKNSMMEILLNTPIVSLWTVLTRRVDTTKS